MNALFRGKNSKNSAKQTILGIQDDAPSIYSNPLNNSKINDIQQNKSNVKAMESNSKIDENVEIRDNLQRIFLHLYETAMKNTPNSDFNSSSRLRFFLEQAKKKSFSANSDNQKLEMLHDALVEFFFPSDERIQSSLFNNLPNVQDELVDFENLRSFFSQFLKKILGLNEKTLSPTQKTMLDSYSKTAPMFFGQNLLHASCAYGFYELTLFTLRFMFFVFSTLFDVFFSASAQTSSKDKEKIVKNFVAKKLIDGNFDDFGRTPLHYAFFSGNEKIILALVSIGANIWNFDCFKGKFSSPLHLCVEESNFLTLKTFLFWYLKYHKQLHIFGDSCFQTQTTSAETSTIQKHSKISQLFHLCSDVINTKDPEIESENPKLHNLLIAAKILCKREVFSENNENSKKKIMIFESLNVANVGNEEVSSNNLFFDAPMFLQMSKTETSLELFENFLEFDGNKREICITVLKHKIKSPFINKKIEEREEIFEKSWTITQDKLSQVEFFFPPNQQQAENSNNQQKATGRLSARIKSVSNTILNLDGFLEEELRYLEENLKTSFSFVPIPNTNGTQEREKANIYKLVGNPSHFKKIEQLPQEIGSKTQQQQQQHSMKGLLKKLKGNVLNVSPSIDMIELPDPGFFFVKKMDEDNQ